MKTKSDLETKSSRDANFASRAAASGFSRGPEYKSSLMSKDFRRLAIAWPMPPKPTIPMVDPVRS